MSRWLFTSEAVCEGHPDKVCDQIADAILDELLKQDPKTRSACEVTADVNGLHIMGEITSQAKVDYAKVARQVISDIGYTDPELGFCDTCPITVHVNTQSPDIAMGVDRDSSHEDEQGAGDQGIMFGYASDETVAKMPLAIHLSQRMMQRLTEVRKTGLIPYLRPDGKGQVTVEYEDGVAKRVDAVVLSCQHAPHVDHQTIEADIKREVIFKAIPADLIDERTSFYINPTGRFVIGGPAGDSGLTGRKLICDTYGGYARHGGGSFSGKDSSKVDRSAAYMARYLAKLVVSSGLAKRCEVQLSYAIGVAKPTSVFVDTFGTGRVENSEICKFLQQHFDLRPSRIIKFLKLRQPIFRATANYGHFGRLDQSFPWEEIQAEDLKAISEAFS